MSANTKIEWADHTFNPWTGCTKVSTAATGGGGCDGCYAEAWSKRAGEKVGKWGAGMPRVRTTPANWRKPLAWNAAHDEFYAAHGRRQRVFCASLADVFDNEVPTDWRHDLFRLILDTPHLDWLLLTKRIGNVLKMVGVDQWEHLGNVWLGATIVNQEEADRDIPKLLTVPARVRFLSMEPLLGPVNLADISEGVADSSIPRSYWEENFDTDDSPPGVGHNALTGERWQRFGEWRQHGPRIDWVIAGGESGHNARPMSIGWARSLRDQCKGAEVPFLFKQWGEWAPAMIRPSETPGKFAFGDYQHDPAHFVKTDRYPRAFTAFGARCIVERVGKHTAGRQLDGREWNGVPTCR